MKFSHIFPSFSPSGRVGVDIGTHSVKVAQVKERRMPERRLLSFSIKDVPQPLTRESVVASVKAACDEARIDSKNAFLSVYGPDIIMRYITLPVLESFDLSRCLDFELERYIPGREKSGMVIDYKILYRLPNNQMVVLLIALEKKIMEDRLSLAREAGLEPRGVNVDCLALMEAFRGAYSLGKDLEVSAILDIGFSVTKLVVFQADTLYFSRDISTSGVSYLLQMVSDNLGLESAAAKELLFHPQEKAKAVSDAVRLSLDSLLDELRLSFEYCARNLQKRISRMYLAGGGSKIQILEESLAQNLGIKTEPLDVIKGFTVPSGLSHDKLGEFNPLIPVAVGLALG
jgi:type IV pilus assembly protein PilM